MKGETVFKKAFNNALDYIENSPDRASLESESHLADLFKISRTTLRKVLNELDSRRLISRSQQRGVTILRRPAAAIPKPPIFPGRDGKVARIRPA